MAVGQSSQDHIGVAFQPELNVRLVWILQRLEVNLARVMSLAIASANPHLPTSTQDDVLRSAVVLLHATLEESLREITRILLPHASSQALNQIPLAGISQSDQPKKYSLGDLVRHKDKSVSQLIEVSVSEYLDRQSFSSTSEIASVLRTLGIDVSVLDAYLPGLAEMIARRHRIVHSADLLLQADRPHMEGIKGITVLDWINTALGFVDTLFTQLLQREDATLKRLQLEINLRSRTLAVDVARSLAARDVHLLDCEIHRLQAVISDLEGRLNTPEMRAAEESLLKLKQSLRGKMAPDEITPELAEALRDRLADQWGVSRETIDLEQLRFMLQWVVLEKPIFTFEDPMPKHETKQFIVN